MINKTVFLYWEDYKPPYIDYCIRSIQERAGVEVILLTPENVKEYIGDQISRRWQRLTWIAQKTDIIRMGILYNHGGLWIDADTIWLKDCNHLFNHDNDFSACRWNFNKKFLNGYIMAKKGSKFVERCIEFINNSFNQGFETIYRDHGGCFFGEHMFTEVRKIEDEDLKCLEITEIPLTTFIPIEFPKDKRIWYREDPVLGDYLKDDSVCIALNHSQNKGWVNMASLDQIVNRNCFLSKIFKYSQSKGALL